MQSICHIPDQIPGCTYKSFAVKFFLNQAEAFTETLEMHDFALAQKTDRFTDFRIFDKT